MKKIAIVGHGFVGKAIDNGFDRDIQKKIIDPKYGSDLVELKDFKPSFIFVCVPTPMADDGTQDAKIIIEVVSNLSEFCPDAIICIKSTVLPHILTDLASINENIVYNPEFLREKHADLDFKQADMLIFGGGKAQAQQVCDLYKNNSNCSATRNFFTDLETASLIKYTINTFLATKVIFFNEIFELFSKLKISDSWNDFIDIVSHDKRIGESHMQVPGHDGRKGFGGACFPKDSSALLNSANKKEIDLSLIKASIKKNNKIRSTYDDLDQREIDQNISYKDRN